MINVILINILIQLIYFILVIFIFGLIIHYINKLFYKSTNYNKTLCYTTGIIGVPIHELSHALMCLLFGHKITEMKLFIPNNKDGVLGYVSHKYNPKNIYQKTGNYFIGIAPIIFGSLILTIAMVLLVPRTYNNLYTDLYEIIKLQNSGLYLNVIENEFLLSIKMFQKIFINGKYDYKWWIFIIVSMCIALHMSLSKADIKNSLPALPFVIIIIIVLNFALGFISKSVYQSITEYILMGCSYLLFSLILSILMGLILLLITIIIRSIVKLVKRH